MKSSLLMNFIVDRENNKINVQREFAAPLVRVWAAWTQPELLDQWWAPKPYKTKTKSMDFSVGGYWLYAMIGPDGTEHWCKADYKAIDPLKSYSGYDAFCDEEGKVNEEFPRSLWNNQFNEDTPSTTLVSVEVAYNSLEDLEMVVKMGIQEGFTAALENLDELLAKS